MNEYKEELKNIRKILWWIALWLFFIACSSQPTRESNWEEVLDVYNRNQPENNKNISKEYLDELETIWKFKENL